MKSLADGLPSEVAQQIHPDWRKNEADYWAVRDQLLAQYQDQWIGVADGAIIASGDSPVAAFHAAEATGGILLSPVLVVKTNRLGCGRSASPTIRLTPANRC